jgi:hypothetical protein
MIDTSNALWIADVIRDLLNTLKDCEPEDSDAHELLRRAIYKLDDLKDEINNLEDDEDEVDVDLSTFDFEEFKSNVIDSIPAKASLKFRMDVEEMLRRLDNVY